MPAHVRAYDLVETDLSGMPQQGDDLIGVDMTGRNDHVCRRCNLGDFEYLGQHMTSLVNHT